MAVELTQGKPKNESGYYKHKETGAIVEVRNEEEYGTAQADAFVQVGYVYIGSELPQEAKVEPEVPNKKLNKKEG